MSISLPTSPTFTPRAMHNTQGASAPSSPRTCINSISTIEKAESPLFGTTFLEQIVYKDEKTGETSHTGIFSAEYEEGKKQTPFAHLPQEIVDKVLSYVDMRDDSKVAEVCSIFHQILAPYYSLEAACQAGAKYHDTTLKMIFEIRNKNNIPQGIIYAQKAEDTELIRKIIERFPEEHQTYWTRWVRYFTELKGLPFLIKESASKSQIEELQQKIEKCPDAKSASILLLNDPLIDVAAGDQFTLRMAACLGYTDLVELLLADTRLDEHGNRLINPAVDNHWTLRMACLNNYPRIVEALLADKSVDPSVHNNDLIVAASTDGRTEVVQLLLGDTRVDDQGAKLVDPSVSDNLAIRESCARGYSNIAYELLSDPRVDPGVDDNYAIKSASKNGHFEIVSLLLIDDRVDPAAENNASIKNAARQGHAPIVRILRNETRVDPSVDDNLPLREACKYGHVEVVKALLDDWRVDSSGNKLVNPAANNHEAFIEACGNGHAEVVKLLLKDPRVDPGAQNNSAIKAAAKKGCVEVLKVLLKEPRIDPMAWKYLPLWFAVENSHIEVVRILVKDLRVSPKGSLNIAEVNKHAEIVKILEEAIKEREEN